MRKVVTAKLTRVTAICVASLLIVGIVAYVTENPGQLAADMIVVVVGQVLVLDSVTGDPVSGAEVYVSMDSRDLRSENWLRETRMREMASDGAAPFRHGMGVAYATACENGLASFQYWVPYTGSSDAISSSSAEVRVPVVVRALRIEADGYAPRVVPLRGKLVDVRARADSPDLWGRLVVGGIRLRPTQ